MYHNPIINKQDGWEHLIDPIHYWLMYLPPLKLPLYHNRSSNDPLVGLSYKYPLSSFCPIAVVTYHTYQMLVGPK